MGVFKRFRATDDAVVIDLRDRRPSQRTAWGRPNRCPECNGIGYLDHIDMVRHVMHQHCIDCWHRWETTEAETAEAESADRPTV